MLQVWKLPVIKDWTCTTINVSAIIHKFIMNVYLLDADHPGTYVWKDDYQLPKLTDLDSLLESHFSHSLLEIFWINLSSWNTFHHYWNSCSSLQVNAHIATLGRNQAYANKAWWWLKHPTCRYVVHGATKCHNISFYHGSTEYSVWGMVTCHFLAAYAVTPYEEGTFLFPSSDTLSGRGSINI